MITLGQRKSIALGKLLAAAVLSATFFSPNVQAAEEEARNAAIADGLSTAVGLAAGAVELNPLGPILGMGMKAALFYYAKSLPDTERPAVYAKATAVWSGAAANNLCITASILTGGSFAPACLVIGAAWAMKTWQDTEHERLFWEGCAMLRQYANEPSLECVYSAPVQVVVTEVTDTVVLAQEAMAP
jgi:hypothetical protein